MVKAEKRFYLVREDILPESILKTALAKEMLASGEVKGIIEAVERLGMAAAPSISTRMACFPSLMLKT